MAVPSGRMSRSNTRSRRSQWKRALQHLRSVNVAGQLHKVPRRLLKAARLGLIDLRPPLSSARLSALFKDSGVTLWLCAYLSSTTIALCADPRRSHRLQCYSVELAQDGLGSPRADASDRPGRPGF